MTREEEIRARLEKATSHGWEIHADEQYQDAAEVVFAQHAPRDIDYLLNALENYRGTLHASMKENQRLRGALEEIRDYERVVHAGSKSWSIANKALAGETK